LALPSTGAALIEARYSVGEILVTTGFLAFGFTVTVIVIAMPHHSAVLRKHNPRRAPRAREKVTVLEEE
jgi:hypothetical protein